MPNYYPLMLNVRGRPAIVIGGDRVASEKAAALVACGAQVTVQSEDFGPELLTRAEQGSLILKRKTYEPGDLQGAFVVVASTHDPLLIQAIWTETQERGQLVNIVDVPEYCSFIVPSILRRGQLTIAVSTEGASPALAKRVRQGLEEWFSPAYGSYVELAALARAELRKKGVSYEERDDFFRDYFASYVLANLEAGNCWQAASITSTLLYAYGVDVPSHELLAVLEEENAHGVGSR